MPKKLDPGAYNNVNTNFPSLQSGKRGELLWSKKLCEMSANEIADALDDQDIPTEFARDAVTLYQVCYSSIAYGEPVVLSGLIVTPLDGKEQLRHMQYHHGTMMPVPYENGEGVLDTPSLYHGEINSHPKRSNYEARFFGLGCASQGYFVSLPDYAGYGIAEDTDHPYTCHPELAMQSIDMILAAQTLASELGFNLAPGVSLSGWSEGGGAALAVQKMLEADYRDIQVIACSALAGPYHMSRGVGRFVLQDNDFESTSIYNWSVYTHNRGAAQPLPAATLWRYPVDSGMDALRVPSLNPAEIYADGVKSNPELLDDLFKVSDLHTGWKPKAKIYLHSGTQDDIVPHSHSLSAHAGLTAAGADIKLYEYEGGDHYSVAFDYFRHTIEDCR